MIKDSVIPLGILGAAVGSLMRPVPPLFQEDSLGRAVWALREAGSGMVPVTREGILVGIVTEASLLEALGAGLGSADSLASAIVAPPTIRAYASGAEALRQLESLSQSTLVVIDDFGHVMGLISPSDLYGRRQTPVAPTTIGGMATPFGVHLTTGATSAGPGHWALVSTGALLFVLFLVSATVTDKVVLFASAHRVPMVGLEMIVNALPLLLFMVAMRSLPLSGIHAAEHKVVHAIERGEELTLETVRRMPRIHPRCGTNLVAGASLFLGLGNATFLPPEARWAVAMIATLFFWRPLGSLLQQYVTTRPPSDKQIEMGIKSGRQLLHSYQTARLSHPNVFQRIVGSGMLHVMAGAFAVTLLAEATNHYFKLGLPL